MDRIDLHIEVPPVSFDSLTRAQKEESSAAVKARVDAARAIQLERFRNTAVACNAQIPPELLREVCCMTPDAETLLKNAFEKFGLSARLRPRAQGRAHDRRPRQRAAHRGPARRRSRALPHARPEILVEGIEKSFTPDAKRACRKPGRLVVIYAVLNQRQVGTS